MLENTQIKRGQNIDWNVIVHFIMLQNLSLKHCSYISMSVSYNAWKIFDVYTLENVLLCLTLKLVKTKLRKTEGEIGSEWGQENKLSQYLAELLISLLCHFYCFWLKYKLRLTWVYHEKNMPEALLDDFEGKEAHFVTWRQEPLHSASRPSGGLNIISWTPEKRHFVIRRMEWDSCWKWQL